MSTPPGGEPVPDIDDAPESEPEPETEGVTETIMDDVVIIDVETPMTTTPEVVLVLRRIGVRMNCVLCGDAFEDEAYWQTYRGHLICYDCHGILGQH